MREERGMRDRAMVQRGGRVATTEMSAKQAMGKDHISKKSVGTRGNSLIIEFEAPDSREAGLVTINSAILPSMRQGQFNGYLIRVTREAFVMMFCLV